jgi:formiminotetrahydrofolate cyclodeaminase
LANGEDRSLVESLTYTAKQLQNQMPEIAERIFTQIFVHLYETANRKKVDMNNSAFRKVQSAFKMMKHGPMEDKMI